MGRRQGALENLEMRMNCHTRRVLVTGSEGYIGSILMPLLKKAGYQGIGLDTGWFSDGRLVEPNGAWPTIRKDIREAERDDIEGFDAVVHLAALSNDPLGEIDPDLTSEINYHATVRLAELARRAGVRRFIFSSSCSMYGVVEGGALDESAALCPLTAYAQSKAMAERELGHLMTEGFSPVFLRNATAYGISPRQRFDLVLPNLAGLAHTVGEVRLASDGTAWRPIVHIQDIGNAIIAALSAPAEAVRNQAFNIGRNAENYQIRQIATAVQGGFPTSHVTFGPTAKQKDPRSYRVNFSKAETSLPSFAATWTLHEGVQECATVFRRIGLDSSAFENRMYTRLRQIRYLLDQRLIDERLRWRTGITK